MNTRIIFDEFDELNCICGHALYEHGHTGCEKCDCATLRYDKSNMKTQTPVHGGDPEYLALLDEMRDLHIRKNAGYSGDSVDRWANFRLSNSLGVSPFLGVLVRMSDKWIRITNLSKNNNFDMVNESLRDTLMDLAAYALIAICLLDEKQKWKQS